MSTPEKQEDDTAVVGTVTAAFGAKNRERLIARYFAQQAPGPCAASEAWTHVYRLLMWTDQTTGLAHCYESDKCQPGKPWYARSLAFHDWLSTALHVLPARLAHHMDWLFLRATEDLAAQALGRVARTEQATREQRLPYQGRGFPRPGEDPELVAMIQDTLQDHLASPPPAALWQTLVQQIRQYLMLENKRKNLVGEGFEDVLAAIVRRTCAQAAPDVAARRPLQDIPGFNPPKKNEKPNKVDLAIVRPGMRTLVTAKWSVRADREKQFAADFGDYVQAESDGKPFEYVFVTNEFDPARLMRACDKLATNAPMFTHVVHINTAALKATYRGSKESSMMRVLELIDTGRLISLERWLNLLQTN
ncbi:hypothetical protein [Paraburkholderia sp. J67]|uniref:hypothetical protein n=1 Tax=Paraburkholderia sp. J67 TaxID=2805435 RepID=UPI002ABE0C02|nr:hypothetical protein [Paraburkholderia sp. J67]